MCCVADLPKNKRCLQILIYENNAGIKYYIIYNLFNYV